MTHDKTVPERGISTSCVHVMLFYYNNMVPRLLSALFVQNVNLYDYYVKVHNYVKEHTHTLWKRRMVKKCKEMAEIRALVVYVW